MLRVFHRATDSHQLLLLQVAVTQDDDEMTGFSPEAKVSCMPHSQACGSRKATLLYTIMSSPQETGCVQDNAAPTSKPAARSGQTHLAVVCRNTMHDVVHGR